MAEAGKRGTIVVPTGGGKTFIALKALATVKVPAIILVITEELMNQWYERVMKYLGIRPVGWVVVLMMLGRSLWRSITRQLIGLRR
ncbi:DEAD/DEAH box helicase family protein [Vulcanisaeta sp. JCM 16159]|uniref:DEAD/DEAH box helicase family protein n=1 Tax=Vulcanisaeta sp. JCM 16159 TaxID=1295371 RepID=UPI003467539A